VVIGRIARDWWWFLSKEPMLFPPRANQSLNIAGTTQEPGGYWVFIEVRL
jgi:hypothetical protein